MNVLSRPLMIVAFFRQIYSQDANLVIGSILTHSLPSLRLSSVLFCCLFVFRSKGDKVLANVSLEKVDGRVSGHVRIRSKSNGLAYMIGNKIAMFLNTTVTSVI